LNAAPLKVLHLEDDPVQAAVIRNLFAADRSQRFDLERHENLPEGLARLSAGGVDVVLLDLELPESCGMETFTKVHSQFPDLPVVVVTRCEDDALGLELVQAGAQDYLVKGTVGSLLVSRTLRYALERKRAATERERLIGELRESLASIKTLSGLVPICASCKKIRDDRGFWSQVETYVARHTGAKFSHGICPECLSKLYPDEVDD